MKPYLREHIPREFSEIPDTTSYEAGYLVSKNAGWRSVRPVIDAEKCVGCRSCMRIGCPCISVTDKKAKIDESMCVGCGLCSQMCRFGAL